MESEESINGKPYSAAIAISNSVDLAFSAECRPHEDPLIKQEKEYKEYIRSCSRRRERKGEKIQHSNAYSLSQNTQQIRPAEDGFQHNAKFEKSTKVNVRRQIKSGSLLMQNSSRNDLTALPKTRLGDYLYLTRYRDYLHLNRFLYHLHLTRLHDYLYLNRLHDYLNMTRLLEECSKEHLKLSEGQHNCFRRRVLKTSRSLRDPYYHHPLHSTLRTPLRTLDAMTPHLPPQETTRVMSYQEKTSTESKKNSSNNKEFKIKPIAGKNPQRKQIEYLESQSSLTRRKTGNEGVHNPNYNSFSNAAYILPVKDGFMHNVTSEEPSTVVVKNQIKSVARSMHNSSLDQSQQLSDLKSYRDRSRENYPEEQHQFYPLTGMKEGEDIKNSNYHPLYSTVRAPLNTLDEMIGVINGYQISKGTLNERDSSKNGRFEVRSKANKTLWGKQIKHNEDQHSLRRRKTMIGRDNWHRKDHPSASKFERIPSNSDERQQYVTFVESTEAIDERQMRVKNLCMQDSSIVAEYDFSPREHEKYPEEKVYFGEDQYNQHGETRRTERILNSNVPSIVRKSLPARVSKFQEAPTVFDRCELSSTMHLQDSNLGSESEESSDELGMESNMPRGRNYQRRLTRRIGNIWLHLCTSRKTVMIGFVIVCVLLMKILF